MHVMCDTACKIAHIVDVDGTTRTRIRGPAGIARRHTIVICQYTSKLCLNYGETAIEIDKNHLLTSYIDYFKSLAENKCYFLHLYR